MSAAGSTKSIEDQADRILLVGDTLTGGKPLGPSELGFLLEVSGLLERPLTRSDAIIMATARELGFTATDDLARIIMVANDAQKDLTIDEIIFHLMW